MPLTRIPLNAVNGTIAQLNTAVTDADVATTGANTFTGAQTLSGAALNEAPEVSVASGATVAIGASASNNVLITGTTTITSFGTAVAGITRKCRFNGSLTLTHNATSMILPGVANINTTVNSTFEAISLGAGNWIVTKYQKADGTAVIRDALLNATQTFVGAQIGAVTALISTTSSVAVNLATNNNFSHITSENTTLASPSNPVAGQSGIITITQGTTARTLAYNTFWKFAGGTVPTLTATAGAVDIFAYNVDSVTRATAQLIKDVK